MKNGFTKCNHLLSKHSDEINEKKEPNSTNPYKIAADKGGVNSMLSYATICEKGNGVEVNLSETAKYYKMAGGHGHEVGMFNYAVMLIQGQGVAVDKKEACRYLKMSADKGLINYAQMRFNGDEIEQDKEEAAKYYKMAADKGDVKCMFHIATISCLQLK